MPLVAPPRNVTVGVKRHRQFSKLTKSIDGTAVELLEPILILIIILNTYYLVHRYQYGTTVVVVIIIIIA